MKLFGSILFILLSNSIFAQSDLEIKLFEMPDVIFSQIETPEGYESAYKLMIKQPIDHSDPSALLKLMNENDNDIVKFHQSIESMNNSVDIIEVCCLIYLYKLNVCSAYIYLM